jgi:surface protein
MEDMFFNCQSITFIPNFNTKNVINMEFTFACCYKLEKIPTWFFDKKKCSVFDIFYDTNFSIIEKLKFFYQDDKLLVKSLDIHNSSNIKIPNNKLDELLLKYE